jgi:hypothetical protein
VHKNTLTTAWTIAAVAVAVSSALGQSTTWTNGTGNAQWGDPGNWTNGVPGATGTATLTGTPIDISLGGQTRSVGTLQWQVPFPWQQSFALTNGALRPTAINPVPGAAAGPGLVLNVPVEPVGAQFNLYGPIVLNGALSAGSYGVRALDRLAVQAPALFSGLLDADMLVLARDGALPNTSAIRVLRSITIDNDAAPHTDRIPDGLPLTLRESMLTLIGGLPSGAVERIGPLQFDRRSRLDLQSGSATAPATFRAAQFVRVNDATVRLLSDSPNAPRITADSAPPQIGGGSHASQRAVVPWMIAERSLPTTASFVTYDAGASAADPNDDVGLRALLDGEYQPDVGQAGPLDNVRLATPQVVSGDRTINSLVVSQSNPLNLSGHQLTIESGALMLLSEGAASPPGGILANGTLRSPGQLVVHAEPFAGASPPLEVRASVVAPSVIQTNRVVRYLNSNEIGDFSIRGGDAIFEAAGAAPGGTIRLVQGLIGFGGNTHHVINGALRIENLLPSLQLRALIQVSAGSEATLNGPIIGFEGRGQFSKTGAGRLRLNGDLNEPEFRMFINEGVVEVNGTLASPGYPSPQVLVFAAGGQLQGNGALLGPVLGDVSPGTATAPGRLTIDTYTSYPDAALEVDLAGTSAGSTYDQLVVLSFLSLTGPGFQQSLDVNLMFDPSIGQAFRIIDVRSAAAVEGSFQSLPEGSSFLAGNTQLRITYRGGTGNDVVLTVVPEPATAGLLGAVASAVLFRRRRVTPR